MDIPREADDYFFPRKIRLPADSPLGVASVCSLRGVENGIWSAWSAIHRGHFVGAPLLRAFLAFTACALLTAIAGEGGSAANLTPRLRATGGFHQSTSRCSGQPLWIDCCPALRLWISIRICGTTNCHSADSCGPSLEISSPASRLRTSICSLVCGALILNGFGASAFITSAVSRFWRAAWGLCPFGPQTWQPRGMAACALSQYHTTTYGSQNARGYMGLMFFSTIGTWLWLEAQERDGWLWWFGYAAALSLGMWLHMTMAFVALAHALFYLYGVARGKRIHWRLLVAWGLFASLTIQLHALLSRSLARCVARSIGESDDEPALGRDESCAARIGLRHCSALVL